MAVFADEELVQFADSAKRFLAEHYAPEQRTAIAADAACSRSLWRDYAELGWLALPVAEAHGGMGGGAVELGVLLEASGRALLLEPLLSTLGIGARLVEAAGSDAQKQALLPSIVSGDTTLAFAHAEPRSGHERLLVGTTAEGGEEARLTGEKRFVLHAAEADRLIVSARAADGTLGLYLVRPNAPGLHMHAYRSIDGRGVADLLLDGVPADRLGSADAGAMLDRVLDLATTALCAESMAIVAELNAATVPYARTRRQFGQAIGEFQVVQHRLVDMMTAEQEGWAITRCAQRALDDDAPESWRIVSAAKARVDHVARFVGEQAIQLHGGIGMSEELMVGHHVKRLMLNATLLGDWQWHLARLGSEL